MLTNSIDHLRELSRKITRWQWIMLIGLSGVTYLFMTLTTLGIGQTPSLPYRYYFTVEGLTSELHDLVSIQGHTTVYHPQPLSYSLSRIKVLWIEDDIFNRLPKKSIND